MKPPTAIPSGGSVGSAGTQANANGGTGKDAGANGAAQDSISGGKSRAGNKDQSQALAGTTAAGGSKY